MLEKSLERVEGEKIIFTVLETFFKLKFNIFSVKRKCNRTRERHTKTLKRQSENLMLDPMDMTMDAYEVNDLKEWWDQDLEVSRQMPNIFHWIISSLIKTRFIHGKTHVGLKFNLYSQFHPLTFLHANSERAPWRRFCHPVGVIVFPYVTKSVGKYFFITDFSTALEKFPAVNKSHRQT